MMNKLLQELSKYYNAGLYWFIIAMLGISFCNREPGLVEQASLPKPYNSIPMKIAKPLYEFRNSVIFIFGYRDEEYGVLKQGPFTKFFRILYR